MSHFFWVCLGGAFGTGVRYLIACWIPLVFGTSFPYATLIVNITGSFLLGILMILGLHTNYLSPITRLALTTGVLGGLTTYSAFNYETLELLRQGAWLFGVLNLILTISCCLLAGLFGMYLGLWLIELRIT